MEAGAALVGALIDAGVDTAFTVPGESFLAVLEALRLNRNRVRLISVRHEGGGAMAAHAYGQIRGMPAAVFVSRGPGATNASIGLHAAHQDSVPMVMFIGQIRSHMKGREAFQEIDPHSAYASMTKAVLEPSNPDQLAETARRAIEISVAGRPGPVVVVMPRDFGEATVSARPETGPVQRATVIADTESLEALSQALSEAERPLILAGELARQPAARAALRALAETLAAPLLCGYRCQDVLDNAHPCYAGHLEINPVAYQNQLVAEADFILVAGSRLDGITSREESLIGPGKNWAHLHPDPAVLARFGADLQVLSDVAPALAAVTAGRPAAPEAPKRLAGCGACAVPGALGTRQPSRAWSGRSIGDRRPDPGHAAGQRGGGDRWRQLCALDPPVFPVHRPTDPGRHREWCDGRRRARVDRRRARHQ